MSGWVILRPYVHGRSTPRGLGSPECHPRAPLGRWVWQPPNIPLPLLSRIPKLPFPGYSASGDSYSGFAIYWELNDKLKTRYSHVIDFSRQCLFRAPLPRLSEPRHTNASTLRFSYS